MDPLGTISALFSIVKYLRDVADKVQQNREECKRLADHAEAVLALIETEVARGISADVAGRLGKLKR
jgi:hypothetical protein